MVIDMNDIILDNEYMGLVYQYPGITLCSDEEYKSVVANEDIEIGELLMVEHVYVNTIEHSHITVEFNKLLFDSYYPRDLDENKSELVKKKINANSFLFPTEDNYIILTHWITMINHSCSPSCCVRINKNYKKENTYIIFMELYSIKNIKKGEEITFMYNTKMGHDGVGSFVCNCGESISNRQKRYVIINGITNSLSKNFTYEIEQYILEYLALSTTKKRLLLHYLSSKGIFFNNNKIDAYTVAGTEFINSAVLNFLNISNVDSDLPLSKGMNIQKIALFLENINQIPI